MAHPRPLSLSLSLSLPAKRNGAARPRLRALVLALAWLVAPGAAAGAAEGVSAFILVDADRDVDIGPLADGATLDLGTLPPHLTLRAQTSPAVVGSVRFDLDGVTAFRTETAAPYALASDRAGDYAPWALALGAHRVTATPFAAGGGAGTALSIAFTLVDRPAATVTGLVLVDADRDADLGPLVDGQVVDLAALPTRHIDVRAQTAPPPAGAAVSRVRFDLDGVVGFHTESAAPYALVADQAGDYPAWNPALGRHTVGATAIGADARAGRTLTASFTLTDSAGAGTTGRFMYAVDNATGAIGVFDIDHGHRLVKTIPTVAGVKDVEGVCASAATGRLYFSHNANAFGPGTSGKIACVDLLREQVLWQRTYLPNVDRLAMTPDGRKLFVPSNEDATGSDFDFVLDGATGDELARVPLTPKTHDCVIGVSGRFAYQETKSSRYVAVIDTATNAVVRQIGPFHGICAPLAINGSDSLILVNTFGLHGFQVGDVRTGQVVADAVIAGSPAPDGGGLYNHGIAWRPDELEAWVIQGDRAVVFDMRTLPPRQTHSLALTQGSHWVNFSIDGRYAYPSGLGGPTEVWDTATYTRIGFLNTSEYALEVDFDHGRIVRVGDQYGIGRVTAGPLVPAAVLDAANHPAAPAGSG